MEFRIPFTVHPFLDEQYGIILRGPEVLAVDQRDNPSLDLDRLALEEGMDISRMDAVDGRRRYTGEAHASGSLAQVVFTPYADCGGEGSRFRTAFPIHPKMK